MENNKNKIGVIYKLTSPNNKIYIGQTVNYINRCRKYKCNAFDGQKKLWNNCQKYNWSPLDTIEIIEECDISKLNDREMYWIEQYNSFNEGLNCDKGGSSRNGFKHSEETKEKLRQHNLGKRHTEESKKKISETLKTITKDERSTWKTNKGKKLSDEHVEKIKEGKKKNPYKMSDENRKRVSENNIGNTNMLGKNHSDEAKRKISEAKKGKPIDRGHLKKIICVDTGEIYENQRIASEKTGQRIANILRSCNDLKRKCNKLKYMYYDDYIKVV